MTYLQIQPQSCLPVWPLNLGKSCLTCCDAPPPDLLFSFPFFLSPSLLVLPPFLGTLNPRTLVSGVKSSYPWNGHSPGGQVPRRHMQAFSTVQVLPTALTGDPLYPGPQLSQCCAKGQGFWPLGILRGTGRQKQRFWGEAGCAGPGGRTVRVSRTHHGVTWVRRLCLWLGGSQWAVSEKKVRTEKRLYSEESTLVARTEGLWQRRGLWKGGW
jgi:hypothetical protein